MHNIRKRMLKDAKNANEAKIEAIMTSVLPDGRQVRGVKKYQQADRFHELFIKIDVAVYKQYSIGQKTRQMKGINLTDFLGSI